MGILDIAQAHFAAMGGQKIEVPEWGGPDGPLALTFNPLSLRARQIITKRAGGNDARMAALVVILHARNSEGALLFEDSAEVLATFENKMDPQVIARIAAAILQTTEETDLGN